MSVVTRAAPCTWRPCNRHTERRAAVFSILGATTHREECGSHALFARRATRKACGGALDDASKKDHEITSRICQCGCGFSWLGLFWRGFFLYVRVCFF